MNGEFEEQSFLKSCKQSRFDDFKSLKPVAATRQWWRPKLRSLKSELSCAKQTMFNVKTDGLSRKRRAVFVFAGAARDHMLKFRYSRRGTSIDRVTFEFAGPLRDELSMTYRGQITKGQIVLDELVQLPEGTSVRVEVAPQSGRITRPRVRVKPEPFDPIWMPGPSLADDLIRDRR